MKIALVSAKSEKNQIESNLEEMETLLKENRGKAELFCFAESFVQGFDSLCWEYEKDRCTAFSQDSLTMHRIMGMTQKYDCGLVCGYFESAENSIYSSCVVIDRGTILYNYRRISGNWKVSELCDEHYREGDQAGEFEFRGHRFKLGLCGDLWVYPQKFKSEFPLIWPVYVNFDREMWKREEQAYCEHAALLSRECLMVNALSEDPESLGNCFHFRDGKIENKLEYGQRGILIAEIE